ncbi:hypothetical protein HDV00_001453 [Rhizophlyctis rosea]|nr:hypothetical protein HDV00_001453 [Rhizophlyctis rosea]
MYRAGWATKPNQERIIAIKLRLSFFIHMLSISCPARLSNAPLTDIPTYAAPTPQAKPDIIIQWDPTHSPAGTSIPSLRAIQIGIRGGTETSRRFASGEEWIGVEDVTDFVARMRNCPEVAGQEAVDEQGEGLLVPVERLFAAPETVRQQVGADVHSDSLDGTATGS